MNEIATKSFMKLLLSLLFPSLALAIPRVETRFIYVNGPGSMPRHEIEALVDEARCIFRDELRLPLKVSIIEKSTTYNGILNKSEGVYLSYLIRTYPYVKANTATLYLVPPLYDAIPATYQIFAGAAYQSSYPVGIGFCVAEMVNSLNEPRRNSSLYGALHELGHELGARHDPDNSCFIMDPGVASCAVSISKLNWSVKSKREIRARVLMFLREKK